MTRAYYELHREECLARMRAYYRKNKEKFQKDSKAWRVKNAAKIKEQNRLKYLKNREKIKKKARDWQKQNKERYNARMKKWRAKNAERCRKLARDAARARWKMSDKVKNYQREYKKKKRLTDPNYRIASLQRVRIRKALKGTCKSAATLQLVGVKDWSELRSIIESKFQPGMNWENAGYYGWHLDHIKPCSAFDLTKESEQRACFHHTNLQPLWRFDNQSKNDKFQ